MPMYVYRCAICLTERDVVHGFHDDPEVVCVGCGGVMRRRPQAVRFYHNPNDVLYDKLDQRYREYRARRRRRSVA